MRLGENHMKNSRMRLVTVAVALAIGCSTGHAWAQEACTGPTGESAVNPGDFACGTNAAASGGFSSAVGSGAVASAPTTRGAAAPQRAWRDARAADTSGESAVIGLIIEQMF